MAGEEQQYERFDMDNDFEGGEWIGGEFHYKAKRQKRMQTRDDQIYGVFADDSDDSGGGGGGRRRRRRDGDGGGNDGDYTRPVNFISTGRVVKDTTLDDEAEGSPPRGLGARRSKSPQQEDDAGDGRPSFASLPSRGGLGSGFAPGGVQGAGGQEAAGEADEGVLPSAFGKR